MICVTTILWGRIKSYIIIGTLGASGQWRFWLKKVSKATTKPKAGYTRSNIAFSSSQFRPLSFSLILIYLASCQKNWNINCLWVQECSKGGESGEGVDIVWQKWVCSTIYLESCILISRFYPRSHTNFMKAYSFSLFVEILNCLYLYWCMTIWWKKEVAQNMKQKTAG